MTDSLPDSFELGDPCADCREPLSESDAYILRAEGAGADEYVALHGDCLDRLLAVVDGVEMADLLDP